MTFVLLPRSAWTATPSPTAKLVPLEPDVVRGMAVHYTGSTGSFGPTATREQSARRLEAERVDHVQGRGWSDIAYSAAVSQSGEVFDCRGVRWRPAANGDQDVNSLYGAVTVLIGTDDTPTQAAVDAVRWWRSNVWLRVFPHATQVVGHRDLHQTACPGDRLYKLVRSAAFTTPPEEDDMPTADEIADALLRRLARAATQGEDPDADAAVYAIARRVWTVGWPAGTVQDPKRQESAQERLVWAARGSTWTGALDTISGHLSAIEAHLAAIAETPGVAPGGADGASVATAVREELARALAQ